MRSALKSTVVLVALIASACSTSGGASPSASAAPTAAETAAASPSAAPSVAPTASPDACANLATVTAGKLTIGTDNPAYPPYYDIPTAGAAKPWELGDPTDGSGFESAFAYALGAKLGFAKDAVTWIVVPFDNSYAPGTKPFDIDVNQVSYTAERAQAVDMSDGYYTLNQAVVAKMANALAAAKTVADLKAFKFGAQVGTTSLDTINNVIVPTTPAKVYTTNDDAIAGVNANQIDGIVTDLPTAFYVTGAPQIKNSVIVGQFAPPSGANAEHFSVVLAKGSPLTACVNGAIAAMKSDGSLDAITKEWLSDKASAPVFQP
jgi:polar amino acid transport system substrate-binding protein